MKCVNCNKQMELVSKNFSFNEKVNPITKYSREIYHCKDCDVWITTEVPVKKEI